MTFKEQRQRVMRAFELLGPARFESDLVTRKIGARRWSLVEPLIFHSAKYRGKFIAMAGTQTDLASIPRIAFIRFPPVGLYDPAAVIHDSGYIHALVTPELERIHTTKQVADDLFLEGMLALGVPKRDAWLMHQAVVLFGNPDAHPLAAARLSSEVHA